MPEPKIKITPAKGRPMLYWIGKKPLDYVKGFPAQLTELFDPLKKVGSRQYAIGSIKYEYLKENWHNLLLHGDNKEVLATLLENGFRGKIDLVYIDPPFKSGADYVRKVELRGLKNLGRIEEDEASVLQQTMYFDIWNNDAYLQFMYERLMLLKELLADTGSIYVHLDWHVGHYIKLLMDEVFGQENFRNEIVWKYFGPTSTEKNFPRKHDYILFYTKSNNYYFDEVATLIEYDEKAVRRYDKIDEHEKRYKIYYDKNGKSRKAYMKEGKPTEVFEIPFVQGIASERLGFATQKPEELIKRFVVASTTTNEIVLDCFCGSGTTLAVAQKLGRRWIGCDINKGAIQITAKRIAKIIKEQIKEGKKKGFFGE